MNNFWFWFYKVIILSGWLNILVICLGCVTFLGLMFGSTNVTGLGDSTSEQVIKLWIDHYLWAWLIIPSIIAIWQAIKNEKREVEKTDN